MSITDFNRVDNLKEIFADLLFKNEKISPVDKMNMSYDVVHELDELSFRISQLEDEIEENQSVIKYLQGLLDDAHITDPVDDIPSFGDEKKEPACNKLFKSTKEAIDRLNNALEGEKNKELFNKKFNTVEEANDYLNNLLEKEEGYEWKIEEPSDPIHIKWGEDADLFDYDPDDNIDGVHLSFDFGDGKSGDRKTKG